MNKRNFWAGKSAFLKKRGNLTVMWDCQWRKQRRNLKGLQTQIGRILEMDNEKTLLGAIQKEEIFGFISCDITTPKYMIENFTRCGFCFPPVVSKRTLTEEHLSPFMKQRYRQEGKSPSETVIQTYHGRGILLMTNYAKLLLDRGIKISNVTRVVQYQPGNALSPFVDTVKRMRIEATLEGDDLKATTAKLVGNSCKYFLKLNTINSDRFQPTGRRWKMSQSTSIRSLFWMNRKSIQQCESPIS